MRFLIKLCTLLLATACLTNTAKADLQPALAPVEPAPFLQFQDGDTVIFVGDSITHQSLYTQYLEGFFYTRYPKRRIRFHNAGVSGDKAGDVLARLEDDVIALKPDHVTLLLGMNDGQYEPFRAEIFQAFQNGVTEILTRVKASGSEMIALSPTMFDHHQLSLRRTDETFRFRDHEFDAGYNSLMAYFGAWLRETSGTRAIPFVNLWGPLNDFTFAARRTQPDFSLVEDAIHPGAAGHFIMAFSILSESQPERKNVSAVTITKRGEKWISAKNETITELKGSPSGDEVSFTFLARSLPWVVPDRPSEYDLKWGPSASASLGYEITKAGHKLSAERLRVAGLAPGNYELSIDGDRIGKFTHLSLASKIELQKYPDTPQSKQALKVAELNRKRNDEAIRPMRNLWAKVKGLRKEDQAAFDAGYPDLKSRIDELHEEAAAYEAKIYEAAQPVPRQYLIKRVE